MRNEDSFMIKLSEEEIRALPVEEKLNILLKITLPILAVLYGNGKEGIKQKVERHDVQMRYIWLLLVPIFVAIMAIAFRR